LADTGWKSSISIRPNSTSPGVAAGETPGLSALDDGEREAIRLAIELNATLLLMDDRDARRAALSLRLPVTGTLGALERADMLGLLRDFRQTLSALEASGFYLSARLHEAALWRHRNRQGKAP
jgi:predicted nucleic acid-binding protein